MTPTTTIRIGALLGALAVILGAFAAHGLKARLEPAALEIFRTGAYYQMVHAIALLLTGLLALCRHAPRTPAAAWLFLLGIALFCGSLYLLALTGIGWLGMITPLGGVSFIAGWLLLAAAAGPDG